jgi:hypothetical protein
VTDIAVVAHVLFPLSGVGLVTNHLIERIFEVYGSSMRFWMKCLRNAGLVELTE